MQLQLRAAPENDPSSDPAARPPVGRIVGLDVARGLAVLGMFGAHIAVTSGELSLTSPDSWLGVVHGRSSILFAVLAGVSIAILSGRSRPHQGAELVSSRIRILVRAAWIFAIGGLLDLLGSGIAVILEYYAVLFVLALPFLAWRPRRLFALAAVLAVAMPVLQLVLTQFMGNTGESTIGKLLVTGTYPGMIWIVFILVGLGVGRLDLTARRIRRVLLGAGIGLAMLGYGLGAAATGMFGEDVDDESSWEDDGAALESEIDMSFDEEGDGAVLMPGDEIDLTGMSCEDWGDGTFYCVPDDEFASEDGEWDDWDEPGPSFGDIYWSSLATADPHSGTPFEVIGSTGVALTAIAICLVVAERLRWLVYPLAAAGAMALTAYAGHVVAFKVVEDSIGYSNGPYLWFVLVTLAVASAWQATLGRGPLERVLTWTSRRAAASR